MKRIILNSTGLTVLLALTALVAIAGSVSGYLYYINGNQYTVGGSTYLPRSTNNFSIYIVSQTDSTYSPGSPAISFQQLTLNTRVYVPGGCPVSKIRDRNGTCTYCTEADINNLYTSLSSLQYIAISKHKLQDTRATNYYGNPPSPFYTEGNTGSGATTESRYRGGVYGCPAYYSG